MLKSWSAIVLASFFLIGCGESGTDNEANEPQEVVQEESSSPEAAPVEFSVSEAPIIQENAAVPTSGLNPAHGEPGHDCAVAVGAPLPAK